MRETEQLLLESVRIQLVKGRPCTELLRLWKGYSNVDTGKKTFLLLQQHNATRNGSFSFFTILKIPTAKLRDCDTINQLGHTDREF